MPKPDGNRLGCEASIDPQKPRAACDSQPGIPVEKLWAAEVPRQLQ